MTEMSGEAMQSIDGGSWGDFFAGLACGATAIGALGAWVAPEPLSKIAAYELTVGAIACVGGLIAAS